MKGRRRFLAFALLAAIPAIADDDSQVVRVGLASLRLAETVDAGVEKVVQTLVDCREKKVD